jgi:hypothetical protein
MSLTFLTLAVVLSLLLMLVLEVGLSMWRNGKAVEIELRDLESLSFEVPGDETDSGEARRDLCG